MSRDALVVGINSYKHLPNLTAPAIDAENIAQRLASNGDFYVWRSPEILDNQKPRIGKQAPVTLPILKRALVQLFKPSSTQIPETALFYFSGHGVREDLGILEGYLATSDANPDNGNFGLSLQWLRRLLVDSPIKEQVIWLDCCHSGELLNFDEANPGHRGQGKSCCFIASSRDFEVSYQDIASDYSVLTKALLQVLESSKHSGEWVTNYSLIDTLKDNFKGEAIIQRPIYFNFGRPIQLIHSTVQTKTAVIAHPVSSVCPYKGLSYFDLQDVEYFYGREALTNQLLDLPLPEAPTIARKFFWRI
ncbi:MAG: caspase family protein [Leptolyngbya sp. SIO4C1]|nr:caspase family protein [Leptolyngbya sp. SIO4C1]